MKRFLFNLNCRFVFLLLLLAAFSRDATVCSAQDREIVPPTESIRTEMGQVFQSFRALQPFLYNRSAFLNSDNEKTISALLTTLQTHFHTVQMVPSTDKRDPGFQITLKVLTEMLRDTKNRFNQGNKEYALWRFRSVSAYCITCHTRYEDGKDFYDESATLKGLSSVEQGEFFLATRQFDRARDLFLKAVTEKEAVQRMSALRGLLIVSIRAEPEPARALKLLEGIKQKGHLSPHEVDEVNDWISSLLLWKREKSSTQPALLRAEALVRYAITNAEYGPRSVHAVELLRASALLHQFLEKKENVSGGERSRALYLLGTIYNDLPLFFFVSDLAPIFLEQCIREFPGSADAKNSFKLYRQMMMLDFTGSSGTTLPADVLLTLSELHDLAFGIPLDPATRAAI